MSAQADRVVLFKMRAESDPASAAALKKFGADMVAVHKQVGDDSVRTARDGNRSHPGE